MISQDPTLQTSYDPFEHAARLGIAVEYQRLRTARGLWVPSARTVILRTGLKRVDERSVLAHEMGHICLGHRDSTPRHEVQADRWAVRKLVDPRALEQVSLLSADPLDWCWELGVSTSILRRALLDLGAAA